MAQVSKDSTVSPRRACATESKKHVAGQNGTAYSRCVAAAARLRNDEKNATSA
jgi:hypothetical protein